MAIAYANKHFKENDERMAAKRKAIAAKEAQTMFKVILYLEGIPQIFTDQDSYMAALKEGWTDGVDGNSSQAKALLSKDAKAEKKDKK